MVYAAALTELKRLGAPAAKIGVECRGSADDEASNANSLKLELPGTALR